ncbi:MAG: archaetidylserine decarboxylase [Thioalkalivibrionaceae bacterium]
MPATFTNQLATTTAKWLPGHAISRLTHRLARWESPLLQPVLRQFVRHYGIDLSEAEKPNLADYPSFNALFTRALRAEVRPLATDDNTIVSPADARVAAIGTIDTDGQPQPLDATDPAANPSTLTRFRAKGHDYTLAALLSDERAAQTYVGGRFVTLYLSPRDYHRLHLPLDARLTRTTLIPGRLFSVAARLVETIPGLYARNERLVCHFESSRGPFALALIGAINVGSIETVWGGEATPPRALRIVDQRFSASTAPRLERGAEFARFNLGSSIILLLPPGDATLNSLAENDPVRVRAAIGRWPH